jgi:hypothetical protein
MPFSRYGAAAHAFLPGRNAVSLGLVLGISPTKRGCHHAALARQHPITSAIYDPLAAHSSGLLQTLFLFAVF